MLESNMKEQLPNAVLEPITRSHSVCFVGKQPIFYIPITCSHCVTCEWQECTIAYLSLFPRQTTEVTTTRNIRIYTLRMVRAFVTSYDEYVGEEEEETARTKKGKNILMVRCRENVSHGAFASQILSLPLKLTRDLIRLRNVWLLVRGVLSWVRPQPCQRLGRKRVEEILLQWSSGWNGNGCQYVWYVRDTGDLSSRW